jgi:ketosteroid isomerase-like protein
MTRFPGAFLALACVAGTLGAQAPAPLGQPMIALPAELDRVLRDYEVAWKAGDGARLAALFTEDGMALPSGSLPHRGRVNIAASIKGPGGDLQLHAIAYSTSDSVGYIIGGFRYPGSTGPGGKYLLALKRGADGRWLIAADMDNSAQR